MSYSFLLLTCSCRDRVLCLTLDPVQAVQAIVRRYSNYLATMAMPQRLKLAAANTMFPETRENYYVLRHV